MLPPPHVGSINDSMAHVQPAVSAPILRQEGGLLAQVFFSQRNVDVVQTSLRYRVYRESGGQFVVGRQSDVELLAIMRDMYESSPRHVPDHEVVAATKSLNEHVLRKAVPNVLSAVRFHDYYLKDIDLPNPVPEERPVLMTTKGGKVLRQFDRLK